MKGTVMRSLVEIAKGQSVELVDGVRIGYDDGWVLALPDPEQPISNVWAEGTSEREAGRLAEEYAGHIRAMLS